MIGEDVRQEVKAPPRLISARVERTGQQWAPTGADSAAKRRQPTHTANRRPKAPHSATWRAVRGVQKSADRLSPQEQARFTEGLPAFVWRLDALTE